jgi:methyltransferase family protein
LRQFATFGEGSNVNIEIARKVLHKLPSPIRRRIISVYEGLIDRLAYAAAPLVGYMARTGVGTDRCLKYGALPLPVHFYSPVPDLSALEEADVWNLCSALPGVDMVVEGQLSLLQSLGERYGAECDWAADASPGTDLYFTENNSFSFPCSASLHTMVRHFKPARVVEIGSGNSTRVLAEALLRNAAEGSPADYTVVDPYPGERVVAGIPGLSRVDARPVEQVDPEFFSLLGANDILFIDSGHTVRMGSDVNFLFLEVLPRLAPGVVVHIHDIPLPYEYPKVYATGSQFRVFWTESYLLQAFLAFNSEFEVLLALSYLHGQHQSALEKAFPHYVPAQHRSTSGSFWMRRKA